MSEDPDEESGIRIRTGDGATVPALTDPVLDGLMGGPAHAERPFLEVARGEHEWIRARYLPDQAYQLTHRTDSVADVFELYTTDPVLIRDIVFAWIDDNPWWSDSVAWSRVDPAIEELESVRSELTGLLDGFTVLDAITGTMDDALARADELLAMDPDAVADGIEGGAEISFGGTDRGTTGFAPIDMGAAFDLDAALDDPFARVEELLAMDLDAFADAEGPTAPHPAAPVSGGDRDATESDSLDVGAAHGVGTAPADPDSAGGGSFYTVGPRDQDSPRR
ncbi:hypothetical protein [Nocardia sp. NPDC050710]|uniref:hypothetical protein n=1 Tax=Nocardia sp. NPDC050710 TaxID=3157220 RepID=UPI00340F709F